MSDVSCQILFNLFFLISIIKVISTMYLALKMLFFSKALRPKISNNNKNESTLHMINACQEEWEVYKEKYNKQEIGYSFLVIISEEFCFLLQRNNIAINIWYYWLFHHVLSFNTYSIVFQETLSFSKKNTMYCFFKVSAHKGKELN